VTISLDYDKSLSERAARVLTSSVGARASWMPAGIPIFFSRAKGARLWDTNGREYIDYMCGFGPNLLGYGDPRIEAAAERQRVMGDTMTGPAPVMVDLAERFVATVSHADWALFCKNGVDSTSIALRIARAQTGKRRVLVATHAYHGAAPWCTLLKTGVLPEERAHRTEYVYNDVASLNAAAADAGNDLAAIFATAFKHDTFADQELMRPEFARRCRELCDLTGALLVVDDVRAGFRLARDCSWTLVGVQPDLSCWSKAIGNGYPISAILGSESAREGVSKLPITATYWTQAVPMAAALATLEVVRETDYLEHMIKLGEALKTGLGERATDHGFVLRQTGPAQMPMILFEDDPDFRLGMAFGSAMVERGIIFHPIHTMFLCAAMTKDDITRTIEAADGAFADLAKRRSKIEPHREFLALMGRFNKANTDSWIKSA
jgi:glutamate-1-semialdehyde 2,1-aminomutase